ncbi:class I fructose-bisphosphate aldolase [Tepidanaerobacter syntrophicus]|uniref:class I fructose-bisphosphate aldolase n=1 Tax=Tepidanaerobacter syntrophicus TaxID=224999 RepID=UPI001BD34A2D
MKRRWHNIFKNDRKAFILAMDHGNGLNVLPEMQKPGEIIKKAVAGGIDGILTTFGIANNFQKEIDNIGLILRIDGGNSQLATEKEPMKNLYSVEDAVRIGADGVLCMGFPGAYLEEATLTNLAKNAADCHRWGLVLGAEMLPRGFESTPDARDPSNVALACRMGAELGADFIKTQYVGSKETFRKIVDGCYRPILVLGGSNTKSDEEILKMVKDSMEAGASGVVMGRNIWRHENIEGICRAITKVIHENIDVTDALKEL